GLAPTSPEAGDASHLALEPSPQRSAAPADRRAAVMKKGSSRPTSDATISSLPCPTKMVLGESDIRLRAPNDSTTMPTAPTPTEIQANTSRPSTANTITIASPANAASACAPSDGNAIAIEATGAASSATKIQLPSVSHCMLVVKLQG